MIDAFKFLPDSQLPIRKEVYVTFISRKGFLREIINEDKLLKTISETVCGESKKCELDLQVFDFQKLTFYQQLSVARNTDILLGMHGAALTSAIYLRNTAAVIEIGHPTRSGNQHFNNLARYMGLRYRKIDGADLLSDDQLESISKAVKEEVDHTLNLKAK
jgi:protein O-GlcNAc transferase